MNRIRDCHEHQQSIGLVQRPTDLNPMTRKVFIFAWWVHFRPWMIFEEGLVHQLETQVCALNFLR